MSLFLRLARALRLAFRPNDLEEQVRSRERTLPEKIAEWKRRAAECERLGCGELARSYRETVRTYERQLSLAAFRKAA